MMHGQKNIKLLHMKNIKLIHMKNIKLSVC